VSAVEAPRDAVVAASEESIAKGSKSFAMAARIFAPDVRDDCVMLYAWCRHCDDVIDGQELGHGQDPAFREGQHARLETLREQTARALTDPNAPDLDPAFAALARVAHRRAIPAREAQALLDGFGMDVDARIYRTVPELLDYCYHVAGVVGVMMARVMGVTDPATLDRASDLGLAFQLTNIARDVIDDARAGRIYLPADLLTADGLESVDPDDPATRAGLHRVALRLLDLADTYYDSAFVGMGRLPPRSALAIAAARRIYRAIGGKLRRGGPKAWGGRVSTTKAEKLALIALAGLDVARSRNAPQTPREGLYQRPQ